MELNVRLCVQKYENLEERNGQPNRSYDSELERETCDQAVSLLRTSVGNASSQLQTSFLDISCSAGQEHNIHFTLDVLTGALLFPQWPGNKGTASLFH